MNNIGITFFAFTISTWLFSSFPALAQGNNMSPLFNKPYFTLKISSFGTSFFACINGASVHREFSDSAQISTSFPINHWMASGKNILRLETLPPSPGEKINPNAFVTIELQVAPLDDKDNITSIASIDFHGNKDATTYTAKSSQSGNFDSSTGKYVDDGGDVILYDITTTSIREYDGGIRFERELDIPSSIPEWAFLSSDNIPNIKEMSDTDYYHFMDTLLAEYMKIQYALESGDIDKILPMLAERNKELDEAFYYPPGTMEEKIRASLSSAANDPDLELVELKRDYVDFTVEDNRKLVSLTRNGLKSAIVLNFKSIQGSQRYNFIFRYKNGFWILTR